MTAAPLRPATPLRLRRSIHHSDTVRWERIEPAYRHDLDGAVRKSIGYVGRVAPAHLHRTVPGPFLPLIVSFGPTHLLLDPQRDEMTRVTSFVAGLHDGYGFVVQEQMFGMQLDLDPLGAFRLFGGAVRELAGHAVGLDALFDHDADRLVDRLASAPDWDHRFDVLHGFVAARLRGGRLPDPEVTRAWGRLVATHGALRIADLAREVGWSRRHLSARFTAQIGLGPKRAARLLRLEHAVELLTCHPDRDLGRIATSAGYYDQAHFSNEVSAFSGLTPTELRQRSLPDGGGIYEARS